MNPSSRFGKLAGGIACFIVAGLCLGASNVAKADSIAYMQLMQVETPNLSPYLAP
jgi:hypothetical protein